MKILLIEDEVHKREELIKCVEKVHFPRPKIVDSVSSAVLTVMNEMYDLIILDMALPTFSDNADDKKKGHDQAEGGIEVLRALKASKKSAKIIIVTQYPDFYIGGARVKLKNSSKVIREKYNQDVIGAVLYHYKAESTLNKIVSILKGLK